MGFCNSESFKFENVSDGTGGKYWRILARRRGSTDLAALGPYKTTEGQYSQVCLELARLVSSLLYGTGVMLVCLLLKRTSGHLNSKGFLRVLLMTRAKEQATTSLKTNSMKVNRVEYR